MEIERVIGTHSYVQAMLMATTTYQPPPRQPFPMRPRSLLESQEPRGYGAFPVARRTRGQRSNDNQPTRGVINEILCNTTNGDSNKARKKFNREEYMIMEGPTFQTRPILSFSMHDLEGITVPRNNSLVIRATIANFDVT